MKNILFIHSSPRGSESHSHRVARSVVTDLEAMYPDATVFVRGLAQDSPPHVGEAFVSAISAVGQQLTPEQSKALAFSDVLIDELTAADVLVLAVPMHNLSIPSTLKSWLDHVVRAGRTFSYSNKGPEGLLKRKRAILVLASGGVYSDGPAKPHDFQEPYLRTILRLIGITDVDVVRVEGVAMSTEAHKKLLAPRSNGPRGSWRRSHKAPIRTIN